MPQAISDFVNATSHLRIYKQAEADMDEQLRAFLSHAAAVRRHERKQEILGMHFDCEADATKYVEDGVLADMDMMYNTPTYCLFISNLTQTRNSVQETQLRLSKLDLS